MSEHNHSRSVPDFEGELPGGIRLRDPAVNAHTLTLLFHRFLSQTEWRAVVEYVRQAPYVVELRADAVVEPDDNPREKTEPVLSFVQGNREQV